MIKDYLISLKNKGNFSWNDLSEMSGIPEPTIRKIFSGDTSDPRFETVVSLVKAMGGSLDEISGKKEEKRSEINAIIAVKELYDARIADLKASSAEHLNSLKRDKKFLSIACCVLVIVLLSFLAIDLLVGSVGWIRY